MIVKTTKGEFFINADQITEVVDNGGVEIYFGGTPQRPNWNLGTEAEAIKDFYGQLQADPRFVHVRRQLPSPFAGAEATWQEKYINLANLSLVSIEGSTAFIHHPYEPLEEYTGEDGGKIKKWVEEHSKGH
jgi:hypothetical protein